MSIPSANEAIRSAQRMLEAVQNEADIYRALKAGKEIPGVGDAWNQQNIARVVLAAHSWRKIGRQVLAIHPEIVEEVSLASSDKIPTEILMTLPYLNPMVVYADPPVFETWMRPGEIHPAGTLPETHMRLLGFFTCGIGEEHIEGGQREQRLYPTSDAHANRFATILVLEALDELGHSVGIEFNTLTMPYDQELTLSEMVDDIMSRFHWDISEQTSERMGEFYQGTSQRNKRWMRQVLSVVVGSLFYLCSTTLETEMMPPKVVAKRMPKRVVRTPISVYKVGWTTGMALTRLRQEREERAESEQSGPGYTQDPQHRRAHFKMQPYGPRNSLRKLVFVSAYWTHVERLGEAGINIARAVPSLGKGEPRQSVQAALEGGRIV